MRQEAAPPAPLSFGGVNIESLMQKAIDAKSAVEVLERLMVMRREAKAEAAKEAFDAAMAAFQGECPVIAKTEVVHDRNDDRKIRYRYAPLDAIVSQVRGLLDKHGFSHRETAEVKESRVRATCKVIHRLGHAEESSFEVPIDPKAFMNEAQKFASALTYAKRYAFCCAFGILTGDADDDANATGGPNPAPARPQAKPAPAPRPPTTPKAAPAPAKPPSKAKKPVSDEDRAAIPGLLAELRRLFGSAGYEANVVRYLQEVPSAQGNILLMPNEGLEDLSAAALRSMITHWDRAQPAIDLWLHENPEPTPGPTAAAAPEEAWRTVVVPIPRKGQRRDDYMANPDTLGALYDVAKTDEEARKRLFGMAHNFEPSKTWVNRDGKAVERKPDEYEAELDFREGLDAFLAWHEAQAPKNL